MKIQHPALVAQRNATGSCIMQSSPVHNRVVTSSQWQPKGKGHIGERGLFTCGALFSTRVTLGFPGDIQAAL